jgi:malate dehydrogenase (quinone)
MFGHQARDLRRESDGTWTVKVLNRRNRAERKINAKFVFVGAGGYTLPLLQRAGIPEVRGFAGFPIGGRFLRSDDPALTAAHAAKVYGVPPLSTPHPGASHLDARLINGKSWLLFGPFAGWTPKFLKQGHVTDLPLSVKASNLLSVLSAGRTESTLLKYLIGQLRMSQADRIEALREFAPSATTSGWQTIDAGQRVQVIRPKKGLEFGTSIVSAADGSIAGLLGASPGASTAVPVMLDVLERSFPDRYRSWLPRLKEMVPSLGAKLSDEPELFEEVWGWGTKVLGLSMNGQLAVTA